MSEDNEIKKGYIVDQSMKESKGGTGKRKKVVLIIVSVLIILALGFYIKARGNDSKSIYQNSEQKEYEENQKRKQQDDQQKMERINRSDEENKLPGDSGNSNDNVELIASGVLTDIKNKESAAGKEAVQEKVEGEKENKDGKKDEKAAVPAPGGGETVNKFNDDNSHLKVFGNDKMGNYTRDSPVRRRSGNSSMIITRNDDKKIMGIYDTDDTVNEDQDDEFMSGKGMGGMVKGYGKLLKGLKSEMIKSHSDNNENILLYNDYPAVKIFEGDYIEGVLANELVTDSVESPVIVQVSRNFYDMNNQWVVIPTGTRIIGKSQVVSSQGADRLYIWFDRIILPNGESLHLNNESRMDALNRQGILGVKSSVNRHFFRKFGSAMLFGLMDGLAGLAQGGLKMASPFSYMINETGSNFREINREIFNQYSNIVPTIRVKAGSKIKVYMNGDIKISPYSPIDERLRRQS